MTVATTAAATTTTTTITTTIFPFSGVELQAEAMHLHIAWTFGLYPNHNISP